MDSGNGAREAGVDLSGAQRWPRPVAALTYGGADVTPLRMGVESGDEATWDLVEWEERNPLAKKASIGGEARPQKLVRLVDDTVLAWQRERSGSKRVGGVSVVQRAGGSLNIHPHLHLLVGDGAWHEQPGGTLRFRPAKRPTLDEVALLAEWIARRLARMLRRRGLTFREDAAVVPPEAQPDPLGGCIQLALSSGHREWQGRALPPTSDESPGPESSEPSLVAIAQGVNVHAGVVVPAGDRAALERLVRYLLRPPLSLQRLSRREDGAVVYRLQRPDRRGRTALVMTPLELLARLAAILPAPRLALRRQLGVLAPGSRDRRKILPAPAPPASCHPAASNAPSRIPWAELLRRVWDLDALRCERCGGQLRPAVVVLDPAEAERYLRAIGGFSPLPILARSRGPPAVA